MHTQLLLFLLACPGLLETVLKKLVGQLECVQPAMGASVMLASPWRQVVHMEGVSRSVGNSRTRRAVHTEQSDCGQVSYPCGGNWRGVGSVLPAQRGASIGAGTFREEQSGTAKVLDSMRTTVRVLAALAVVTNVTGCAYLVERSDEPGRYAQCQKRGCL